VLLEYEYAGELGWQDAESTRDWENAGVVCENGVVNEIELPANTPLPGSLPASWSQLFRL